MNSVSKQPHDTFPVVSNPLKKRSKTKLMQSKSFHV